MQISYFPLCVERTARGKSITSLTADDVGSDGLLRSSPIISSNHNVGCVEKLIHGLLLNFSWKCIHIDHHCVHCNGICSVTNTKNFYYSAIRAIVPYEKFN